MNRFCWMPVVGLAMALSLVSCSASDDELGGSSLGEQTMTTTPSFSMLGYSQSESTPILQDGSNSEGMDEKLVCKILPGGKLMLTHKNVVFDDAVPVKMDVNLQGQLLVCDGNGRVRSVGQLWLLYFGRYRWHTQRWRLLHHRKT